MRVSGQAFLVSLAASAVLASLVSCTPVRPPAVAVDPAFYAEIAAINTAAYPEDSYTVQKGDTPRAIAARVGADYRAFAATNGITDQTVLQPGQILVVPRVRPRGPQTSAFAPPADSEAASAAIPRVIAPPAARSSTAPAVPGDSMAANVVVTAGNVVSAASGTVSAVHRGYLSLGDVVIIETGSEKLIYSGSFAPAVASGQTVAEGQLIATGAAGPVRLARYQK